MDAITHHPLIALGRTPISKKTPPGVSVRYEAIFEQLETELAKQESLSAASVEWPAVVKLASEILKSHSKDLLVGVYLCHALVETEGYAGLNAGLTILNEMIASYWEGMFPPVKRLRARKTAMQWLAEKTGRYVESHSPANQDFDAVLEAAKLIRKIDAGLAEKMGDGAPVLSGLTRPLKQYKGSIQQHKAQSAAATKAESAPVQKPNVPPGKPAQSAVSQSVPQVGSAPRPVASVSEAIQVTSEADARKGFRQIQENLRKLATFLLKAKITDPRPYRLSRMSAWMVIDQLPPHKDGVTQISPPAAERRKQLALLLSQGDPVNFLQGVEQTLARAPFWLDGQRMTAQALKTIGASSDVARRVVIEEISGFLRRLPTVKDLKFADDTPFADDQTMMWINSEILSASDSGLGSTARDGGMGDDSVPWKETLPEAQKLASEGKMKEAIDLFDQGVAAAPNLREQFRWRLELSGFLIQTEKVAVAVQLLERLAKQAEQFQLDRWEPRLVVPLYRLLSEAYLILQGKNETDGDLNDRIERNYARLCWTDPALAITIK
ncbi:MAG: type VI secretion system protein TssA [bacterium]